MSKRKGLGKKGLSFVACAVGMPLCAYILPGIHVEPLFMSVFLGLLMGVFFLTIRPILKLLTLPIGCLTMGLFSIALDTVIIVLLDALLPGFALDGPEWAFYIACILTVLRCPILK